MKLFYIVSVCLLTSVLFFPSCNESSDKHLFELISSKSSGIDFRNTVRESEEFNVMKYGYFYNGGGVAVGDLNNDGLPDIYFTANMKASHLYVNKGDFEFEEIAEKAGVQASGLWNTGVTMADVNNDGWLDIYVCRSAATLEIRRKNLLFINNHDMTFTESAGHYGLDDSGYSTQAVFFDYDRDDDLDMFLINHSTQEYAGFSNQLGTFKSKSNRQFGDKLYRNDLIRAEEQSFGRFTNVTDQSGIINNVLGFGLGVAVDDLNEDGWLDIYVSNDYNEEDYCYINQQDGTFKESVREYFDQTSLFSMGSDIADINNDGLPEVYTLDMLPESNYRQKMSSGADNYDKKQSLYKAGFHYQAMRNMLHLNNGNGSYSEIGQLSGISNTDWSWAALFADFDLDGWKDLFVSNGYKSDYTNMEFMSYAVDKVNSSDGNTESNITEMLGEIPPISVANYVFKNQGDLSFSNETKNWGLDKESLSNGAAYADLDNDGDLDLIINNVNEEASVYRNNANTQLQNHFLKIALRNKETNSFGIGSKIKVVSNDLVQTQTLMLTRGFQSSVPPVLTFGLGKMEAVDKVEITWSNGKRQEILKPEIDQLLTIAYEPDSTLSAQDQVGKIIFSDISSSTKIDFQHVENLYIDFKRESLLLHLNSTQGPGITVGDVNGDQLEDVFICGATDSNGKLFLQTKFVSFTEGDASFLIDDVKSEDVEALFFDADNDEDLDLYVVSGGSEHENNSPLYQDRLYINDGNGIFTRGIDQLPKMLTSSSCVKAQDVDNDGDQDLFVGGRLIPGSYPFAPSSYLLLNDGNGRFTKSTDKILDSLGMVTDAIWTDLNDDAVPDLIVVGEWMPITFLVSNNGKFQKLNSPIRDGEASHGWWNVIEGRDFDGDGDEDFVLGNFGENTQLIASKEEPIEIIAKDFDSNGSIDPILSNYNQGVSHPMAFRDDLLSQIVALKKDFVNYEDYAKAKTSDLFNEDELENCLQLKANRLSSSYLDNKGDGTFELKKLPLEAQFAPVYSLVIKDFNEDRHLDILLAGNFTDSRVQLGRSNASNGTLLVGDGTGGFKISSNVGNGLSIKGNVRDLEIIRLNNGKSAILIAKNNDDIQILEVER